MTFPAGPVKSRRATAPGKLVLLGEYAVLAGGVALVAAVDRRAVGSLGVTGSAPKASAVVSAVLEAARRRGWSAPSDILVDTAPFHDSTGSKLGLGSSAAVAVVASALVSEEHADTLDLALEAHRAASKGEGSGVDVAASFHGGVIATRKQPADVLQLPPRVGTLHLAVLYTGRSASTADLVKACRRSRAWEEQTRAMADLANEGVRAWLAGSEEQFLSVVARYGQAMATLGASAGAPIVTEEIAAVMRLAEESGVAAAKPSGAGGGDVAIIFTREDELPSRIAERTGTLPVPLAIDSRGLE